MVVRMRPRETPRGRVLPRTRHVANDARRLRISCMRRPADVAAQLTARRFKVRLRPGRETWAGDLIVLLADRPGTAFLTASSATLAG
jgi:hypothetical protein